MAGQWSREDAYQKFEDEGEEFVRLNVERGSFHGELLLHARAWLRSIDEGREAESGPQRSL
jgi:hypothetical protein